MKWHAIKYPILGVQLYAVEREGGYIDKYCDTLPNALKRATELNEPSDKRKSHVRLKGSSQDRDSF